MKKLLVVIPLVIFNNYYRIRIHIKKKEGFYEM